MSRLWKFSLVGGFANAFLKAGALNAIQIIVTDSHSFAAHEAVQSLKIREILQK